MKSLVFSSSYTDGILSNGCNIGCVPVMEGKNPIINHPSMLKSHRKSFFFLYHTFTSIFNGIPPITFNFKWLREMHRCGNTGCHLSKVYMNRGSSKLLTCWIPFDNLILDMNVLVILEGSHHIDRPADGEYMKLKNTYADMNVERNPLQGMTWFTQDPMEFYQLNDQSEAETGGTRYQYRTVPYRDEIGSLKKKSPVGRYGTVRYGTVLLSRGTVRYAV